MRRYLLTAILILVSASASAQATRTWVSGSGSDLNPCGYASPCKTFAGALAKTATGGFISAKDPGPYGGPTTINKSITIDGGGTYASAVNVNSGSVFAINFTANDSSGNMVILRGLSIDSDESGIGIDLTGTMPTHLHVVGCTITRTLMGVRMHPGAAGSSLRMRNVSIDRTATRGIDILPPANGTPMQLTLENVRITRAEEEGIALFANTNGTISRSLFSQSDRGIDIWAPSIHLNFTRSVISENATEGFRHRVSGITTVLDGCSIFGNQTGILNPGSTVLGFSNNSIANNITDVSGNAVQSLLQQ